MKSIIIFSNYFLKLFLLFSIFNYNLIFALLPSSINSVNETTGFKFSFTGQEYGVSSMNCDINGDGHIDLVETIRTTSYLIVVYFGPISENFEYPASPAQINGTNGFIFQNNGVFSKNPSCGDVNNDSYDDILVYANEAPGYDVFIYGAKSYPSTFLTIDGQNGFFIRYPYASTGNPAFGYNTAIGDHNGDGIKDLFLSTSIGAFSGTGTKVSFLIYGINGGKFPVTQSNEFDLTTLNGANGFLLPFDSNNCQMGDLNNDGMDDIIMNNGQISLGVVFGIKSVQNGTYSPAFDGIDGTKFIFSSSSIESNFYRFIVDDFNGDSINDVMVGLRAQAGFRYSIIILGKTEYPKSTNVGFNSSGVITIAKSPDLSSASTFCSAPIFSDINGDAIPDVICNDNSKLTFSILFGKKNYYKEPNVLFVDSLISSSDVCSGAYISGLNSGYISISDFNSDKIIDFISAGSTIVYGSNYFGSIEFVNLFTPFNSINNLEYKIFEKNSFNIIEGPCSISTIKLNIKDSFQGDSFIIDFSNINNNSSYSFSFINDTSLIIDINYNDNNTNQTLSIIDDVLENISILLSLQFSNRTVELIYGIQNTQTTILGAPFLECTSQCLNGGECNSFSGLCSCIDDYLGMDCSLLNCTVSNECINGTVCNSTTGLCEAAPSQSSDSSNSSNSSNSSSSSDSSNSSNSNSSNYNKKDKSKVGVIVGPIIGGCVFISIVFVIFFLVKRKRFKSLSNKGLEMQNQPSQAQLYVGGKVSNIDKF